MLLCGDSDGRMFARTGKTVWGGTGGQWSFLQI